MQKNNKEALQGLEGALDHLYSSAHERFQIEIYYNKELVLQIQKAALIQNWDVKLPFSFDCDFILTVFFKRKLLGVNYHRRFKKNSDLRRFRAS